MAKETPVHQALGVLKHRLAVLALRSLSERFELMMEGRVHSQELLDLLLMARQADRAAIERVPGMFLRTVQRLERSQQPLAVTDDRRRKDLAESQIQLPHFLLECIGGSMLMPCSGGS